MESSHRPYGPYEKYVKRPLDVACALAAIALLWWLILLIALLVRVRLGSPVIFSQERPGRGGRVFRLYKFRTMTDERGADGELLPDEERATRFGNWLRSTSLDELPEIFNILWGDMSVIGPRPLLVRYLPYYTEREMRRHDVRPGLTGLAQVSGRDNLGWDRRLAYDAAYAEHITFLGDLRIFLLTIRKVISRADIVPPGSGWLRPLDEERAGKKKGNREGESARDAEASVKKG